MLSKYIPSHLSLSLSVFLVWFTSVIKFNNSTIARNSSLAAAHCERASLLTSPSPSQKVSSGRALCACHNISLKSFHHDADKAHQGELHFVRCSRDVRDEKIFCAVFHGYHLLSYPVIFPEALVPAAYTFRPIDHLAIISTSRFLQDNRLTLHF